MLPLCRYAADALLTYRLARVRTVKQLRELLHQLHLEGWLEAQAPALQGRVQQQAAAQQAQGQEEEEPQAAAQHAQEPPLPPLQVLPLPPHQQRDQPQQEQEEGSWQDLFDDD